MKPGPFNLITDVDGLLVGNADDDTLKSGVTALVCPKPATAAVQVLGGAPGTRETDLLEPHNAVEQIDAIAISGGSAFGLDAASGVQAALREQGVGFQTGDFRIPIVPSAIIFDLTNGGDKDWGRYSPYRELGYAAVQNAAKTFDLGTAGAGHGALTAIVKGGLGSASCRVGDEITLGAIVAANPMGSVLVGEGPHFWASPFEIDDEFGGLGLPNEFGADATDLRIKFRNLQRGRTPQPGTNTTIGVIATDAVLTKAEAKRLAISAHDGFARAIWPTHTAHDGDLVFAIATGASGQRPDSDQMLEMCAAAGAVMARAIARGVYEAVPAPGDVMPAWRTLFGDSQD
ncbi:P1 family peptidase [Flavimaribacter sediminis]|uniref:P1 family peptidase n=1 Tax=Flavimaribacter sediminis TaxID=2865987 RepID=UPI00351DEFB4